MWSAPARGEERGAQVRASAAWKRVEYVHPGENIQASIDRVYLLGGGRVVLLPGVHRPTWHVYVKANVELCGYGRGTGGSKLDLNSGFSLCIAGNHTAVSDIYIESINTTSKILFTSSAAYVRFERVIITGSPTPGGYGIYAQNTNAHYVWVRDCSFNNLDIAIYLSSSDLSNYARMWHIESNYFGNVRICVEQLNTANGGMAFDLRVRDNIMVLAAVANTRGAYVGHTNSGGSAYGHDVWVFGNSITATGAAAGQVLIDLCAGGSGTTGNWNFHAYDNYCNCNGFAQYALIMQRISNGSIYANHLWTSGATDAILAQWSVGNARVHDNIDQNGAGYTGDGTAVFYNNV